MMLKTSAKLFHFAESPEFGSLEGLGKGNAPGLLGEEGLVAVFDGPQLIGVLELQELEVRREELPVLGRTLPEHECLQDLAALVLPVLGQCRGRGLGLCWRLPLFLEGPVVLLPTQFGVEQEGLVKAVASEGGEPGLAVEVVVHCARSLPFLLGPPGQ
jgi:hypothetical protein